jgi:hypothetical protein
MHMTSTAKRQSLRALGAVALAAGLAVGTFATTAQARWGDHDVWQRYHDHDRDRDHDHDGRWRIYTPPPVVYYGPGYGYYPPPVVYGPPSVGIYVPGISLDIH